MYFKLGLTFPNGFAAFNGFDAGKVRGGADFGLEIRIFAVLGRGWGAVLYGLICGAE